MAFLYSALDYLLLVLGLGFVIFFHELGHFLAAKYCDVQVEQFAVGFGPAIVAWRKGVGFRRGTTTPAYDKIIEQHFDSAQNDRLKSRDKTAPSHSQAAAIGKTLGIGETEYRLNWVPLGGYVKMLGQDDLKPGVTADDPRAYNSKSVGARMVIVSAGVVMNVILAGIGFMIVFMMGYPIPPATVGGVYSLSPAAQASRADGTRVGFQPGDQILDYDGSPTHGDFSKIILKVALTPLGDTVPIKVRHPDGKPETLYATPAKMGGESKGLPALGIEQPFELAGPVPDAQDNPDYVELAERDLPDMSALRPGDVITRIADKDVRPDDIPALYAALAASDGKPVDLTVKSLDGKIRQTTVTPHFADPFDKAQLNFLGMVPRAVIAAIIDKSAAIGKMKPGDVILSVDGQTDHLQNPTPDQIKTILYDAGDRKLAVSITVLDPGSSTPRVIPDLIPDVRLGDGKIGLGISLGCDEQHLVVAQTLRGSTAYAGKIPSGATLLAIDNHPISNWFEVRNLVANADIGQTLSVTFLPPNTNAKPFVADLKLAADDIQSAREITLTQYLPLRPMASELHTHNPFVAISWGVVETRDLILEFYLTLQRMLTGDVSPSNMMGPIGMVHAGAQVASKGIPWLLWFLCNISANLAVVNFLPIPIVDGGLFTLLILEKIQGKPLSPETQRIVQMVGLVLILGVFLLVTYQDVARMYGY